MSDIVERLRELEAVESELACECDCPPEATANYRYAMTCAEAADTITALRAENERLKIENIQMQAALGYGILADDERHILPSNPFKCGTCDASKHLRAEVEDLGNRLHHVHRLWANNEHALRAENERLRAYALKAFTVVEFCCGEGLLLETPFYDCDDLLLEGVNLLNVETAEEARAALEESK